MYKVYWLLSITLLFTGCSNTSAKPYEAKESNEGNISEVISTPTLIATNLEIPWTITKNQATFYITQRVGRISQINQETGDVRQQEIRTNKEIIPVGEGGLLGFVLSPNFDISNEAYLYHTYSEGSNLFNRIILAEKEGDRWVEKTALLERIPGGQIHNGGRMRIGPDNKLYITTGDAGIPTNAQKRNNLGGKILRMSLDGSIPTDNPFPNSYVYSYGHRNPQGLAWDEAGVLYSTEHGQSAHDEINLIKPGQNYGWPIIEGDEEAPNMVKPLYHTGDYTWAPSGIDYSNGKLFIATLRDSKIRSYEISSGVISVTLDINSRMRDVLIEEDTLFTVTNNRDGRGTPQKNDDKLLSLHLSGMKR